MVLVPAAPGQVRSLGGGGGGGSLALSLESSAAAKTHRNMDGASPIRAAAARTMSCSKKAAYS